MLFDWQREPVMSSILLRLTQCQDLAAAAAAGEWVALLAFFAAPPTTLLFCSCVIFTPRRPGVQRRLTPSSRALSGNVQCRRPAPSSAARPGGPWPLARHNTRSPGDMNLLDSLAWYRPCPSPARHQTMMLDTRYQVPGIYHRTDEPPTTAR